MAHEYVHSGGGREELFFQGHRFNPVLVARKLTAAHALFDLLQEKPVAFKWSHDHTLARMESHPLCVSWLCYQIRTI